MASSTKSRWYLILILLLIVSVGTNIYLLHRDKEKQPPKPQVSTETAPDSGVLDALDKLKPVKAEDTLTKNAVIRLKGRNFLLNTYLAAKAYLQAKHFGFSPKQNLSAEEYILTTLPDNETRRGDLIKALRSEANYLNGDNLYNDNSPLPHRIHYSWGSDNYLILQKPTDSCSAPIHGLDCSGMIYVLFNSVGGHLRMSRDIADKEYRTDFLTKTLKPYFGNDQFTVTDLGPLTDTAKIQDGDIMYLRNASGVVTHIGIVFVNAKGLRMFYNCHGNPDNKPGNEQWCTLNLSAGYGMAALEVSKDIMREKAGNKRIAGFVRISTP